MSETNVFCGKVWICTSHSLSFRFTYNHSELTIFNSFNLVVCEFFRRELSHGNFRSIRAFGNILSYNCLRKHLRPTEKRRGFDGRKTAFFFR